MQFNQGASITTDEILMQLFSRARASGPSQLLKKKRSEDAHRYRHAPMGRGAGQLSSCIRRSSPVQIPERTTTIPPSPTQPHTCRTTLTTYMSVHEARVLLQQHGWKWAVSSQCGEGACLYSVRSSQNQTPESRQRRRAPAGSTSRL